MPIRSPHRVLGPFPAARLFVLVAVALAALALLGACSGDDDADDGDAAAASGDASTVAEPAELTSYRFTLTAQLTDFAPGLSAGDDTDSSDAASSDADSSGSEDGSTGAFDLGRSA